jgi:16S rRNA U516 pseudouridylate synthase RsuA-like enzyme
LSQRRKAKTSITNEELDILSTLQALNANKITPDKARIFLECAEESDTRRYEYYNKINGLVDSNMIDEHREYYDTAVPWRRYSISKRGKALLKKA